MNCRLCAKSSLISIIALGQLPLANAFSDKKSCMLEKKFNLEVMLCHHCGLAQLRDIIDPKELFSQYLYFSSYSDTMLFSAKQLVDSIIPKLPSKAFIIEIGSNDGYLLKNYKDYGINVLGIDPAENVTQKSYEAGIPVLCNFFNADLAETLQNKNIQADIIHVNNVMAHVPTIKDFVRGLKLLLKKSGYAIIEVPYFLELIRNLQFDTIYHEHVYYFSVKPLKLAFEEVDLEIFTLERIPLHGGSLRLFVGHKGKRLVDTVVNHLIQQELAEGLYEQESYLKFMQRLYLLKSNLINRLVELKKAGKKIAAYGASAKGTILLNFFGIGSELLDFIVDRSLQKQGLYVPGTILEIKPPESLIEKKIDYALLLSWNFSEEIFIQQRNFLEKGGEFIMPLPDRKVIA